MSMSIVDRVRAGTVLGAEAYVFESVQAARPRVSGAGAPNPVRRG